MELRWDIINANLEKYIKKYYYVQGIIEECVLKLCDRIMNVYGKYGQNIDLRTCKIEYPFMEINESIEIVGKFYKSFDESLYNSYRNIIYDKEKTFIQLDKKEKSCVNNNKLYLCLEQNSSDIFTICHETAHAVFQSRFSQDLVISMTYQLMFTEVNTITLEHLINEHIEENNLRMLERVADDFLKVILYMFINWITNVYKRNSKIDDKIFWGELNSIENPVVKNAFKKYLGIFLAKVQNDKIYDQLLRSKYIIASALSATLFKRFQSGAITKEEYIKMMSDLNKIESFEEALNILNLNYIENSDILDTIEKDYDSCCEKFFNSRNR